MISELNGQENYFTRICAGGLLNTRKLELAHMLLQDINMFHLHPNTMPAANLDNNRLISSAISNMTLNEKKLMKKTKLPNEASTKLISNNIAKSSSNLTLESNGSMSNSPQLEVKMNSSKTEATLNRHASHYYYNHSQQQHESAAANIEIKESIESSINDLASFTLYSSRKPLRVFQPIKDHTPLHGYYKQINYKC